MNPFKQILTYDKTSECFSLCLIEEDDQCHSHSYDLVFSEDFVKTPELRMYVGLMMCDYMNGGGKKSTFKQIVARFNAICRVALKLKL